PAGRPVFPDSGSGFGFDYPGYGAQPPPGQPIAPPYGSAAPPSPHYAYAPAYGQQASVPPTSGFAIASLICSIASWFLLPFIGGVLAVIFGHIARQEIRRSQGRKRGNGLLLAGLVIGYIHIAIAIVVGVVFLWLVIAFASDGYRS
ncbi:MAG: DUF4190 domain-containing protein, partial [Chloroflexota bacterium]|nr:DUF4190 domain-containing protein [Chloroflexota bacterium]